MEPYLYDAVQDVVQNSLLPQSMLQKNANYAIFP